MTRAMVARGRGGIRPAGRSFEIHRHEEGQHAAHYFVFTAGPPYRRCARRWEYEMKKSGLLGRHPCWPTVARIV